MSRNRNRRPRPAGAPEPQDFKPKSPAAREAAGDETVPVEFRGMSFEVPADPQKWSYWRVMQWIPNHIPNAVVGLLGQAQIVEIHRRYPDLTGAEAGQLFGELFTEIAKACGFGSAGNS